MIYFRIIEFILILVIIIYYLNDTYRNRKLGLRTKTGSTFAGVIFIMLMIYSFILEEFVIVFLYKVIKKYFFY